MRDYSRRAACIAAAGGAHCWHVKGCWRAGLSLGHMKPMLHKLYAVTAAVPGAGSVGVVIAIVMSW
jgi:hypothetical protein